MSIQSNAQQVEVEPGVALFVLEKFVAADEGALPSKAILCLPGAGVDHRTFDDDLIPSTLEPEDLKPNRTWARLIQKIYEADPLTCPKCQGRMKIISFIEEGKGRRVKPSKFI